MNFHPPVPQGLSLHSTMFLLKLSHIPCMTDESFFTFHNVSIKTVSRKDGRESSEHFTFHNVSIKTSIDSTRKEVSALFTFHNVSIKTRMPGQKQILQSSLHSTMFLLKPIAIP